MEIFPLDMVNEMDQREVEELVDALAAEIMGGKQKTCSKCGRPFRGLTDHQLVEVGQYLYVCSNSRACKLRRKRQRRSERAEEAQFVEREEAIELDDFSFLPGGRR